MSIIKEGWKRFVILENPIVVYNSLLNYLQFICHNNLIRVAMDTVSLNLSPVMDTFGIVLPKPGSEN